jgi:hypothetical protein
MGAYLIIYIRCIEVRPNIFLKFFVSVPLATVLNVVLACDTRLSIDPFLSHPMWNSLMSIPMTIPLEPGALSTVPEN